MSSRTWPAVVATVALAAVVVSLGVANPPQPGRVGTDALGPESGELVTSYLERADASLTDADESEHRWALVSFDAPITTSALLADARDVRVSQVLFRVPVERVQTPIVAVPVADNDTAVLRAPSVAAARLQAGVVGQDRTSQVAAYSADRLSAGCACVVGATVRGSLDQLRALAAVPGVRAVEALPGDAVAGAFSVNPLLPTQTTSVVPGPDDGPVPALG